MSEGVKKVFQVWERDYNDSHVVATYDNEAMARDHAETCGLDYEETEVLSQPPPDVTDPVLRQQRAELRAAEAIRAKKEWDDRMQRQAADSAWRERITIHEVNNPSICRCYTYADRYFMSANGYCGMCGGWRPDVIRQAFGDEALMREIGKPDLHHRNLARQYCGLAPE